MCVCVCACTWFGSISSLYTCDDAEVSSCVSMCTLVNSCVCVCVCVFIGLRGGREFRRRDARHLVVLAWGLGSLEVEGGLV